MTPEQLAASGSELGIQSAFFCALREHYEEYPQLRYIFHIPNGGERNVATAARLKQSGVKKGVPDVCIPVPNGECHGMYLEFKAKKGVLSPEQKDYAEFVLKNGYAYYVVNDYKYAVQLVLEYLSKLKENNVNNSRTITEDHGQRGEPLLHDSR